MYNITAMTINKCLPFVGYLQLFPVGSVPLKTYLPDGDIDLAVLSPENSEEEMGHTVCNVLGSEEDLEYEIKDIQYIDGKVW